MDKILHSPTLAGAAGALAWYVLALQRGWIKNDHYIRKGSLEIIGGSITATYVQIPFFLPTYTVAFVVGAGWSLIIQRSRAGITKTILESLDKLRKSGKKNNAVQGDKDDDKDTQNNDTDQGGDIDDHKDTANNGPDQSD